MSKTICEICGTSYPDNADKCPICGYVPDEDEHPSVQIGNALFTIKSMDDRSIDKIDVVILPEEKEEEKEEK